MSESVEIPRKALLRAVPAYEDARVGGESSTAAMRAALVAARPYLMPTRDALVSTFMDFRERNGGCPDGPDCAGCRDIAGDEADAVLALLNGTKS